MCVYIAFLFFIEKVAESHQSLQIFLGLCNLVINKTIYKTSNIK